MTMSVIAATVPFVETRENSKLIATAFVDFTASQTPSCQIAVGQLAHFALEKLHENVR